MSSVGETLARYPIGENESQTRRLITQAQLYNPSTRAFFASAGITRGMKVLELGSGVGDVTLLLAELVGPAGQVVGVEVKPGAVEVAKQRMRSGGWQNASFLTGEVESVRLDQDFDAVVGRFVLMWLPDPLAVLQRVVSHLRPGGIVAFQDNDFTFNIIISPPLPAFESIMNSLKATQDEGGPDFHMGLKLHSLFESVGLPPPQLSLDAPIGTGPAWSGYRFIAETIEMLQPRMLQLGVVKPGDIDTSNLAERIRNEAIKSQTVIVLPAIVGAWSKT